MHESDNPYQYEDSGSTEAPNFGKAGRDIAVACHLAAFVTFLGIPFGNILGPLIIWLLKRNEFSVVDFAGREAVNFQITATIVSACLVVCIFIGILTIPLLIGIPILVIAGLAQTAVVIGAIVLTIIAAIETNNGVPYKYPYSMRLL